MGKPFSLTAGDAHKTYHALAKGFIERATRPPETNAAPA